MLEANLIQEQLIYRSEVHFFLVHIFEINFSVPDLINPLYSDGFSHAISMGLPIANFKGPW